MPERVQQKEIYKLYNKKNKKKTSKLFTFSCSADIHPLKFPNYSRLNHSLFLSLLTPTDMCLQSEAARAEPKPALTRCSNFETQYVVSL